MFVLHTRTTGLHEKKFALQSQKIFNSQQVFTEHNTNIHAQYINNIKTLRIGGLFSLETNPIYASVFQFAIHELQQEMSEKFNVTLQYLLFDAKTRYNTAASAAKRIPQFNIHGVITDDNIILSRAIAQVSNDYNFAQLSFGANAAEFGLAAEYFNFARIYPSNSHEAFIMADLIKHHFKWSRVILLYSTDLFGILSTQVFKYYANKFSIDIIGSIGIIPIHAITNETDQILIDQIKAVKQLDGRIWVVLLDDVSALQHFFLIAENILSIDTYFIGGSAISTGALWGNTDLSFKNMHTFLTGYIGINNADYDWTVTKIGRQFLQKWKYSVNEPCEILDDFGNKLSQYCINNITVINPLIGYLYDATKILTYQLINFCRDTFINNDKTWYIPSTILGSEFIDYLIDYTNTSGITGNIQLYEGIPFLGDYEYGDRIDGLRFQINSYINLNNTQSGMSLQRVGTWTSNHGFLSCYTDKIALELFVEANNYCYDIQWGTQNNIQPNDRPDPLIQHMPNTIKIAMFFLSAFVFANIIGVAITVIYYRKSRLIKASQYPMLHIILCTLTFASSRIAVAAVDVSLSKCMANYWLGHLGFIPILTFFSKTLRVHLLINNQFKKLRITSMHVIFFTAFLISIMIFIMIIATGINDIIVTEKYSVAINGQYTFIYFCNSESVIIDWVLYAFEILMLFLSVKLCYDTRNVPDAVNESGLIVRAMFVIMCVCSGAFACVMVLNLTSYINELIIAISYFICSMSILGFYFFPKLWLLFNGADINNKFQIVYKRRRSIQNSISSRKIIAETILHRDLHHEIFKHKYLTKLPNTIEEARDLIQLLQSHLMILTQKLTMSSNASSFSNSVSRSQNPSLNPSLNDVESRENSVRIQNKSQGSLKDKKMRHGLFLPNNVAIEEQVDGDIESSIIAEHSSDASGT